MAALLVGSGKGNGPGGVGVLGVAPGATLKTYAMFNTVDPAAHQNLDCWGPGLAAFIDRIVADGAQVIQIPVSLDVTGDEIQAAFNRAFAKGVVVVAASGNGGPSAKVMSPGGNAGVLVVGGMQADGKVLATNPTSTLDSWEQARSFDVEYNIHLVAPGRRPRRWRAGTRRTAGTRPSCSPGPPGRAPSSPGQLALMKQKWPTGHRKPAALLAVAGRAASRRLGRVGAAPRVRHDVVRDDTDHRPDGLPRRHADLRLDGQRHERPADPAVHPAGGGQRRVPPGRTRGERSGGQPGWCDRRSAAGRAGDDPVASTSGTAWLVWLVCGLVAVALLAAGGWALTRNRAPRSDLQPADTPEGPDGAGSGPQPETAGQAVGRPSGRTGQGEDTP